MALLDAISNTVAAPAAGDLVYLGELIAGPAYQDGKIPVEVLLGVLPGRSFSTATAPALTDIGSVLLHPSSDTTARTVTIPANASVAFPVFACLTIVNQASAGALTIAITSDTLTWLPAGTTGSRTLAANGMATLLKVDATNWIISGVGLT